MFPVRIEPMCMCMQVSSTACKIQKANGISQDACFVSEYNDVPRNDDSGKADSLSALCDIVPCSCFFWHGHQTDMKPLKPASLRSAAQASAPESTYTGRLACIIQDQYVPNVASFVSQQKSNH